MSAFVLHIAEDGDNFKLIWNIPDSEDVWTPSAYSIDGGMVRQASNAVRAQLRAIAFMSGEFKSEEFADILRKLAQRGHELFLQLMPASDPSNGEPSELQQRLTHVKRKANGDRPDFKITLGTEKLFIPWAFIFPGAKDQLPRVPNISLTDMKGFWLSQFNISIAYGGSASFPHQRKASSRRVLALHEEMFVNAKSSLATSPFGKECLNRLDALLQDGPTPSMDWDSFEDAWMQVRDEYDTVLYVFGHSDGQRIQLNDVEDDPKYALLSSSLKRFRKRSRGSASIFMLNGCRTAAPIQVSADEPISANFLTETRQPGYYGFIGTEAQVPNTFACHYGTEFLWRLCKEGKSVGEAFDELLERDDLFPQNILYTCYADRQFRFTGVEASP
jgi:hypothetical protein